MKQDNPDKTAQPSNLNVPNVLTSIRIIAVPLFAWLVIRAQDSIASRMWVAFACFALLMLTDKLDGDIARARGLVTDFGKIADPIADKALMITAFVCLNIVGALPVWVTVLIVFRELGITLWRMVLLRKGQVVPASKGGKLKTALQSLLVGLYLIPFPSWVDPFLLVLAVITVIVTVYTGLQYILDGRKLNSGV